MTLSSIEAAVAQIARGGMVVVVDDEDRENEGDLVMAAGCATPEALGFMVRHSSGVVCAPLTRTRAEELGLPPMVAANEDPRQTAYTLSCDARDVPSTGISGADRARTLAVLADPSATAADLVRPGHVFPLIARDGGVLTRPGHTEAAVDLARLAGTEPAGAIAEVVHDDGTMMRLPALTRFAAEHGLPLISIEQLAAHLSRSREAAPAPPTTTPTADLPGGLPEAVRLPTAHGDFLARAWRIGGHEYLSLSRPAPAGSDAATPLVRVHSECLTGDVFGSQRCDCGEQLHAALGRIAAQGGTLIYMSAHEGRGIGLVNKLAAYRLQEQGYDTFAANLRLGLPEDARDYAAAAVVLRALGENRIRLLTDNPAKRAALTALGIDVVATEPLQIPARPTNARYLAAKRERVRQLGQPA